ncbi:MAG: hypothetical protein ABI222_14765, partial [Opitutaceae bacterium]
MADVVLLRFATEADAAALCVMHIRSIREVCAQDYSPEQIEAWTGPKRPEHYFDSIRGQRLILAEQRGRIAGFGDISGTR